MFVPKIGMGILRRMSPRKETINKHALSPNSAVYGLRRVNCSFLPYLITLLSATVCG